MLQLMDIAVPLGDNIVVFPQAEGFLKKSRETPAILLARHEKGEWSRTPIEDRENNLLSLGSKKGRVVSIQETRLGQPIMVVTDFELNGTAMLTAAEYGW
jgi:hypothetical protein